jgi:hypothetical protein
MIQVSYSGSYEEFCLLGYNSGSPVKVNKRLRGICILHL